MVQSAVSETSGSSVLHSLHASLAGATIDSLHQYLIPDTHLDLSAAWTTANHTNDSTTGIAICKAIAQVLARIDHEDGFSSPGAAFVRRILQEQSRQIWRNLSSLRPMYVNPTLRLLLTMAQFDAGTVANDVYLALDFNTAKVIPKLLSRAGTQTQRPDADKVVLGKRKRDDGASKEAMRTLFIELLLALLEYGSSVTKAEIIQRKPVMQEWMKHLCADQGELVIKTIKGLSNVLESRNVPKSAKVQFWHGGMLEQFFIQYAKLTADLSS